MKLLLSSRPHHHFRKGSKGVSAFTIIEVLVATGILVLIIFAVYSTWTSILRATKVGLNAAVEVQRSRIAMRSVEDALLTAQNFGENSKYYYFLTDTKDENYHYLSLAARLPPTFLGAGYFGDYNLRRVSFECVPAEDGKMNLLMTQMPVLWLTNVDVTPYTNVLVRDITLFILEFWDKQKGEWMADFTATNQLPVMMRVTVGWGHLANRPSEPTEVISRTIAIPSSMVTGEIQRPQMGANPAGPVNNQPPRSSRSAGM